MMMDTKGNTKNTQQRILKFLQLNRIQVVIGACSLVAILHFVLYWVHYDGSVPGRAARWLAAHGIRSMRKRGGVVIFLHRPRTGGRSVKGNLNKADYGIVLSHPHANTSFARAQQNVERILSGRGDEDADPPPIQFLSLHEDFAMLPRVKQYIEKWRAMAKKHRTALFVFTLVRNPIDYHLSHFNEYRVSPCDSPFCVKPLLEPNDANLLSDMKGNEQCRGFTKLAGDTRPVTDEECTSGWEWMKQNMDWIGTTAQLSTQTLPLLAELLFGDADRAQDMPVLNAQKKTYILRADALQSGTEREVMRKSALDQTLYDNVRFNYYF